MPITKRKYSKEQKQGVLFLLVGVFLIFVSLSWRYHQERILSFDTSEHIETRELQEEKSKPSNIKIDNINMNLDVEEGMIIDEIWQISKTGASHLDVSANPGEGDNVVIYGHNKNSLFGSIRWLEIGKEIVIINEEGEQYQYQIIETKEVSPQEIEFVLPKGEEMLTLYTCSGFLDRNRFIVIAKPKE